MSKVEFIYNNTNTQICCIKSDSLDEIVKRFLKKYFITNERLIFYYSGKKIDLNSIYSETINESDKKNRTMKINVLENPGKSIDDIKFNPIICTKCLENCKFSVENYKINLDCPNNHKIDNILIEEFYKNQNINENKTNYSCCKTNPDINSEENKMYFCIDCKRNLCIKCKVNHSNSHSIINYEDKNYINYICKQHKRSYDSYCLKCKKNICIICYSSHKNHEIKSFGYMMPDLEKLSDDLKKLSDIIDNFKNNINEIINKLTKVAINASKYLKLYSNIVNDFNYKQINYEILNNLNCIDTNKILKDFCNINNESNILKKFKNIMEIYEKMTNETIIIDKEKDIQIMNDKFCDLKINGVKLELNISNEGKEIINSLNKGFDSFKKKSKKKQRHYKRKKIPKDNEEDNDYKNEYINNSKEDSRKEDKESSEDEKDEINFYENFDEDKSDNDNYFSKSRNSIENEESLKYSKMNSNRLLKKNNNKYNGYTNYNGQ